MDADCVRVVRCNMSVTIFVDVSGRRLATAKDVSNVCDGLANVMMELRTEDPGMNIWLDRLDLSQNALGNAAIAALTKALLHQHVPRVLLLWQNCISDAAPLRHLFATGYLQQLHLSGNKLPEKEIVSLVTAAVAAKQFDGTFVYPFIHKQRKTPLWLRLENQRTMDSRKNHDRVLENIDAGLRAVGLKTKDAICFVQGTCLCCPELCCCRTIIPAVHLTYLKGKQLHGHRLPCSRTAVLGGQVSHAGNAGDATNAPKCPTVRRSPALCVGVAALPAYCKEVKQPAHRIPDWLQPSPPPGLERYRFGCCRSSEPWLDHNSDMVTEASAVCIAANGSDFRIVTNDYTAEDSRCMSVKIGDVVVPGATTDFEGYIFALDTLNDRSGYIPLSVFSA